MKKFLLIGSVVFCCLLNQSVLAQQTSGTLVVVAGTGEVRAVNDQAKASFFIEEQDKDKSAAASRVNQKMQQGTEILKKLDPQAHLATHGYYTYPVYSDVTSSNKIRTLTGWRVGQNLELTTTNLQQLPTTVAAVQQVLALNGLNFGLSESTLKALESQRLEAAYANMQLRVQIIAKAMGREVASASIESLDFEGPAAQMQPHIFAARSMMAKAEPVAETSFEAGETTLTATVLAKIKFN